ncbi:hypothetical protein KV395_04190 [Microbacterium luteolum]|uniref:DUF3263 domain-containing protein n=1 Tax=Microbacterium luteolum TaxID=69367 RepID=A0ABY7XND2_MICLT|nr:hypothetical protein [Microbacterium luteolum]WDM42517.1 hypothetical protein KV395_04190 [Microbacterium luteolum]
MMDALTPREEEYFKILSEVNPSPEMRRIIEETKRDRRHSNDNVVRGLTPFKGFQREE